jgi:2-iminobutanoate/2-iminopropanoate deaminase
MSSKRVCIAPANKKLDIPNTFDLPYATGIKAGDFIFLSGLIAIDSDTGERAHGTVVSETRLILSNMAHILESSGSNLERVVKATVWLHSMLELDDLNATYRTFFPNDPPARTVCGARINYGMKVQIDCIALT